MAASGHGSRWRVDGVDEIREQWGDPAAEEFLRSVASAMRATLRESDKVSPVGRAEYGIVLDAPSEDHVMAGLERLVRNVAELAGRDHRWSGGSLCVGVTPLDIADAAFGLEPGSWSGRARRAGRRRPRHARGRLGLRRRPSPPPRPG